MFVGLLLPYGSGVISAIRAHDCSISIVSNTNRRAIGGLVGRSYNLTVVDVVVENFNVDNRAGNDGRTVGVDIGIISGISSSISV